MKCAQHARAWKGTKTERATKKYPSIYVFELNEYRHGFFDLANQWKINPDYYYAYLHSQVGKYREDCVEIKDFFNEAISATTARQTTQLLAEYTDLVSDFALKHLPPEYSQEHSGNRFLPHLGNYLLKVYEEEDSNQTFFWEQQVLSLREIEKPKPDMASVRKLIQGFPKERKLQVLLALRPKLGELKKNYGFITKRNYERCPSVRISSQTFEMLRKEE